MVFAKVGRELADRGHEVGGGVNKWEAPTCLLACVGASVRLLEKIEVDDGNPSMYEPHLVSTIKA